MHPGPHWAIISGPSLMTPQCEPKHIEVHLNGINSLQNFMKIYQAVQKLLVGGQTDRHTERLVT
jgi:hypothetical protein